MYDFCESAHEASAELKKHLVKRHEIVDPDLSMIVQENIRSVKQRYSESKV